MRTQKLSERIFLFMDDHHNHENVVVIWTHNGPLVVDAFQSPTQFAAVEKHIRGRGYEKPLMQIYTHWHPDHTLGNCDLTGVQTIAHTLTWGYLEKGFSHLHNGGEYNNVTRESFDKELIISPGGMEIHLLHAPGHTIDSSIVYIPEFHLVIAGDNLVGPEVEFFFPPVLEEDQSTGLEALATVYKQIRQLMPKVILPGHGWVLPPDEMLSLNEHRFKNVLRRTTEVVQRGLQCENLIRAWLSQANACATMVEQEALKQNVSRVLRLLSEGFDQTVLHSKNC
ncbi:MAG: MBL fold metallo-hydrolase [Desulfitobacteriaceae bacterium]